MDASEPAWLPLGAASMVAAKAMSPKIAALTFILQEYLGKILGNRVDALRGLFPKSSLRRMLSTLYSDIQQRLLHVPISCCPYSSGNTACICA